jgi:sugar phosphate isomerase/epimerase
LLRNSPREDLFDGETYEMFLKAVNNHSRVCILYDPSHFVLQQLITYSISIFYHERIKAFHVKDAEFNPTGKQGTFEDIRAGLTALDATAW